MSAHKVNARRRHRKDGEKSKGGVLIHVLAQDVLKAVGVIQTFEI